MNTPDLLPGSRVFPLKRGKKTPLDGSHSHLKARPYEEFDFSLVPRYYNYGISLDGQFLVIDIDDAHKFYPWKREQGLVLPHLWVQQTRRGLHYLYRHEGGGTNKRVPGADIKVNGYIVGPGSIVDSWEYRRVEPIL